MTKQEILQNKLEKIKRLRLKLMSLKVLYSEYDSLVEEVMPNFITYDSNKFIVRRRITVKGKTYILNPSFYNADKCKVVSKVWKSTAFPAAIIE